LLVFLLLQQRSLVLIGAIVVHHWSPEVPWHGVAFFCHEYVAFATGHRHLLLLQLQLLLPLLQLLLSTHSEGRIPAIVGDSGLLATVYWSIKSWSIIVVVICCLKCVSSKTPNTKENVN